MEKVYLKDDWIKNVKTKPGVSLDRLNPEARVALKVGLHLYQKLLGIDVVVTSTNDGKHMKGSKHYKDQAFDSRIWHLSALKIPVFVPKEKLRFLISEARRILGRDYDIILEKTHIHWEFDPK